MRKYCLLLLILLLAVPVSAQDFTTDPNANITWPPPVFVLRGEFALYGTADLPNMVNYFLEYRRLSEDFTPNENALWIPITLPSSTPVREDVLGMWDTATVADGPYEIRMTVNVTSGSPVFVIVRPVRVENDVQPAATATPTPEPEATASPVPTDEPTPTVIDRTPRVEAAANANVRSGDSTVYPVVAGLSSGETAPIVAISNTGSGWYQIELPGGGRGWVSPTVVRVQGDLRNVPRVAPPPPPVPTATPTPAAQANLVIQFVNLSPDPPRCNETFTISARVANNGNGASTSGGLVSAQDVHVGSGSVSASTDGVFPPLAPGETYDSVMRMTVSTFYNETHRLTITVDSLNQVPELNEGDNVNLREYVLSRANC